LNLKLLTLNYLVDTHTHLFLPEFDEDRDEIVSRAISNNVKKMVIPNVDDESIEPLFELCKKYPDNCYPLLGLHPESVKENYQDKIGIIEQEIEKRKIYGIGEIGLDFYWDITYKKEQEAAFDYQLNLALKLKLPVVIHIRNSYPEVLEMVGQYAPRGLTGIFHCFSGSPGDARQIIEMGFYIGIGGVVTFKNSKLAEMIPGIPLSSIVLETDSPYLAPVPHRGKRNESSYIVKVAERIAELKGISLKEVTFVTTGNALKIFNLE
jgi:TatD DNase family protein